MKNNYAITVLQDKIKEIEKTRDCIIANSFPYNPIDEIIKIELTILTLNKSIGALEKYTRHKIDSQTLVEINTKIKQGSTLKSLSQGTGIHENTIGKRIREIKEIEKKYKKLA